MLSQMLPAFGQMFGGDANMTVRQMVTSMQLEDEEQNLPMMEFFYDLNVGEIFNLATGNWNPITRLRPQVCENLQQKMGADTAENRAKIVQQIVTYFGSTYDIPPQYQSQIINQVNLRPQIEEIVTHWIGEILNITLDYQGDAFAEAWKRAV